MGSYRCSRTRPGGREGPPSPYREPPPASSAVGPAPAAGLGSRDGILSWRRGLGLAPHPPRARSRTSAPRPGLWAGCCSSGPAARQRRVLLKSLPTPGSRGAGPQAQLNRGLAPGVGMVHAERSARVGGEGAPSLASTARTCSSSPLASCTSSSSAWRFVSRPVPCSSSGVKRKRFLLLLSSAVGIAVVWRPCAAFCFVVSREGKSRYFFLL